MKRRRLGRAHRAKIAKGLRRYWRQVRARRAKRNRRDRARRALRRQQRELLKKSGGHRPRIKHEEWEITIRYTGAVKRKLWLGLTCRVVAPAGTDREVAILVARRAGQGHVESGFRVHFINWQKPLRETGTGPLTEWDVEYGDSLKGLQFPRFTALFAAADVRAERVRED